MAKHYIVGSGSHGCLYDNGPHAHKTLKDAVEDLAFLFELGERKKRELRKARYLELGPKYGADYCEITECTCGKPWEHNEEGSAEDWPEYRQEEEE